MDINRLSDKRSLGIQIALFTYRFIKRITNESIRQLLG